MPFSFPDNHNLRVDIGTLGAIIYKERILVISKTVVLNHILKVRRISTLYAVAGHNSPVKRGIKAFLLARLGIVGNIPKHVEKEHEHSNKEYHRELHASE
jgi:hypothetical protein